MRLGKQHLTPLVVLLIAIVGVLAVVAGRALLVADAGSAGWTWVFLTAVPVAVVLAVLVTAMRQRRAPESSSEVGRPGQESNERR